MRLVAGVVACLLTASLGGAVAHADPAARGAPPRAAPTSPAPAPSARVTLRVVSVMPETHQALLFDRHRNTHVLVEINGAIDGYRVLEITQDEVVLSGEGREVVLAAPATAPGPAPLDPYAPATTTGAGASPLQAGDDGVRVAQAPGAPDSAPAAMARPPGTTAPVGPITSPSSLGPLPVATPELPSPAFPADAFEPPGTTATEPGFDPPGTAPTGPQAIAPTTIDRADLTAALADFGQLTRQLRGSFTVGGARLEEVAPGSVFARAGLRAGDVVTAIDGRLLRSIDDAADLYVRAQTARAATVQVMRGRTPVTLRISLR